MGCATGKRASFGARAGGVGRFGACGSVDSGRARLWPEDANGATTRHRRRGGKRVGHPPAVVPNLRSTAFRGCGRQGWTAHRAVARRKRRRSREPEGPARGGMTSARRSGWPSAVGDALHSHRTKVSETAPCQAKAYELWRAPSQNRATTRRHLTFHAVLDAAPPPHAEDVRALRSGANTLNGVPSTCPTTRPGRHR